jgi:hypothetical protein
VILPALAVAVDDAAVERVRRSTSALQTFWTSVEPR